MRSQPLRLRTSGADDTRALAAAVAATLRGGDVVALAGELGAGKTCFVQGAAAALGVTQRVTSPTFTLVRVYRGDLEVVHVDVYRLDRLHEVDELGDDLVGPDRVTFVEWGDAVAAVLPPDRLEVELLLGEREEERLVRCRGFGGWEARLVELATRLTAWIDFLADPVVADPADGDAAGRDDTGPATREQAG